MKTRTKKILTPLHPPRRIQPLLPLPLHPPLPLPVAVNHPACPVSFVLLAGRIAFPQSRSNPLVRVKGSRLPNGLPAAPMMTSLRSRGGGGRQSVWRVSSAESVRSLAGNHLQTARIGHASEFPFLSSHPLHITFLFGNLTGLLPFLVSAEAVEWIANTRLSPVAVYAATRQVALTSTPIRHSDPPSSTAFNATTK